MMNEKFKCRKEWWSVQWSHVNQIILKSIRLDHLDEFKRDVFQHLNEMQDANGFHQRISAIHILAKRLYLD
jgi:hypothetical protein